MSLCDAACVAVNCGAGTCKKDEGFHYHCECEPGNVNMLNNTKYPCVDAHCKPAARVADDIHTTVRFSIRSAPRPDRVRVYWCMSDGHALPRAQRSRPAAQLASAAIHVDITGATWLCFVGEFSAADGCGIAGHAGSGHVIKVPLVKPARASA
ncbi:hypothetical protein EJB05_55458, partial [Eragrostis curvula]